MPDGTTLPGLPNRRAAAQKPRRACERPALPDWPALMCEDLLARYLGMSKTRLRRAVQDHDLPAPRTFAGKKMWSRAEVDRTIARTWDLSNDHGLSEDRGRNSLLEAARAFQPPASRVGRKVKE